MTVHPLDILLIQAITDGVCDAAATEVLQEGDSVFRCEMGAAPDTVFDIASVTKIISTTASMYHLVSEGQVQLDDPVSHYLSAFGQNGKDAVTLRELLGHRSGLPAWAPLFTTVMSDSEAGVLFQNPRCAPPPPVEALARARRLILDQVMASPLVHAPGTRIYSDLGFITLGAVIESVVGQSLHQWTQDCVFPKLGLESAAYRPLANCSEDEAIPPTGITRPREPAPGQESLYSVPEQEELDAAGFVDDDNAFALGGIAGHAGVFASAKDVALFGWRMLEELDGAERLGAPEVLKEMLQPDAGGGAPLRGLGFDHPSGPASSAGWRISKDEAIPSFGHLGFTGCSLWVDPVRRLSIALLTNRVYPTRRNVEGIKGFRPIFHDTLIDFLETEL